ncbi:hypothetical protein ACFL3G_13540 [Planctomycetota bacterium]
MSFEFKCTKCGGTILEVIQTDAVITSQIIDIDEEGYFEYEQIDCDGGNVDRYQCYKCGDVLKDNDGESITTEKEVFEWVKQNCKQDKEKS